MDIRKPILTLIPVNQAIAMQGKQRRAPITGVGTKLWCASHWVARQWSAIVTG